MKPVIFVTAALLLLTAMTSCQVPGIPSPALTDVPATTPQILPTQTPPTYPAGTDPLGVAVTQSGTTQLAFYDLDGTLLGTRSLLPGDAPLESLHVFGSASGGLDALGLLRIQLGQSKTTVLADDQVLLSVDGILTGFVGVPGEPVLALASASLIEPGILWQMFLVTPESLPGDAPVLSMERSYGGAISPVHIALEDGLPAGIWYIQEPYALGGEIIFYPSFDLYYLDLATGVSTEYVPGSGSVNQAAFSPDGSLLAYVDPPSVTVLNMQNGVLTTFPILPGSEHGAGECVFSPDDRSLAWKEASGSNLFTMDYQALLRIAALPAGMPQEFTPEFFKPSASDSIADMHPLAWVDGDTLLVGITGQDGTQELWLLQPFIRAAHQLAQGVFTGLLYP